jgi:hypothetical protein
MQASSSAPPDEPALKEYEVEQKFALTSAQDTWKIETRLQELGFVQQQQTQTKSGETTYMVDWYWEENDSNGDCCCWTLTTQDCWLRHRQVITTTSSDDASSKTKKKGSWQLKLGRKVDGNGTAATVYEEIVGPDAISKALTLLSSSSSTTTSQSKSASSKKNDHEQQLTELLAQFSSEMELPPEMMDSSSASRPRIIPFAKIETRRSSWVPGTASVLSDDNSGKYAKLKVDMDTTQFGYAVGEVEMVVHEESEISPAQNLVQVFVAQLLECKEEHEDAPPVGKLEYYLIQNRPDHYQALRESGVLK